MGGIHIDPQNNQFDLEYDKVDGCVDHTQCLVAQNNMAAAVAYLCQDDLLDSPRDEDTFGTMFCYHRNYNLGDKPKFKPSSEDLPYWFAREVDPDFDQKLDRIQNEGYNDLVAEGLSFNDALKETDKKEQALFFETITASKAIILSLYLADHGGLSISATDYGDHWDSGKVGVIFVMPDKIKEEFGDLSDESLEKARNLLLGEVSEYDLYLKGEVYGIVTEMFVNAGTASEPIWEQKSLDSSWGMYGEGYAVSCIPQYFEPLLQELPALALSRALETQACLAQDSQRQHQATYTFEVHRDGVPESVSVAVASGDIGGDEGAFESYIEKSLKDWFQTDVALVEKTGGLMTKPALRMHT